MWDCLFSLKMKTNACKKTFAIFCKYPKTMNEILKKITFIQTFTSNINIIMWVCLFNLKMKTNVCKKKACNIL